MTKLQKHLEDGSVFYSNGKLSRKCPECSDIVSYDNKRAPEIVIHNLYKHCDNCRIKENNAGKWVSENNKGENNPFYGKKHSPELIEQIRQKNIGRKHSEETKAKMTADRMGHIGCIRTEDSKLKQSIKMSGKCLHGPVSDETKRKHRVAALKHLQENGIFGYEDKGAREYFTNLNPSIIINYPLNDIGYTVDGYDKEKHTIYEYDTPYHNRLGQKRKDAKRQMDIIDYFNKIENPLNGFIRINSTTKELHECCA